MQALTVSLQVGFVMSRKEAKHQIILILVKRRALVLNDLLTGCINQYMLITSCKVSKCVLLYYFTSFTHFHSDKFIFYLCTEQQITKPPGGGGTSIIFLTHKKFFPVPTSLTFFCFIQDLKSVHTLHGLFPGFS